MFRKLIYLILPVLLLLSGCSSSTKSLNIKSKNIVMSSQDEDADEFADEFEDEAKTEESDPFRGYNVAMTSFNDTLYESVFNPIARGYSKTIPKEARQSVGNFFHNLMYPIRFINNILQGKFLNAAEETGRFVVNTVFGIFGLFDTAGEYFHWQPHNEDFGQTLGYWGVGSGYHIVLPFFGPSNMRDMFSMYPDSTINPMVYDSSRGDNLVHNNIESMAIVSYDKINDESLHLDEYKNLKKDAVDLYPFLKNIYEQHRKKLIKE